MIFRLVEEDGEDAGNDLSDDRGKCSACHTHFRQTQKTENQDRVKDDIHDRTDALREHCVDGLSGRLQHSFERKLHKTAERQAAADGQIFFPV